MRAIGRMTRKKGKVALYQKMELVMKETLRMM